MRVGSTRLPSRVGVGPPARGVALLLGRLHRRDLGRRGHPPLGQEPLAVPHAVLEGELTERRPVAGSRPEVRAAHRRADAVGLEHGRAQAERREDLRRRQLRGRLRLRAEDGAEQGRAAAGVLLIRARSVGELLRRDVAGHVGLAVEHLGDGRAEVIGLVPRQATGHPEQLVDRDRGAVVLPLGAEVVVGDLDGAVEDEAPSDEVGDRLRHRPAELGRVPGEAVGVALADDRAVADHDHGPRAEPLLRSAAASSSPNAASMS